MSIKIRTLLLLATFFVTFSIFGQGKITRPTNIQTNIAEDNNPSNSRLLSDLSGIKIGDWVTSDGRYSHEKLDGIIYACVVYSLSPTKKDAEIGYTHGYIVALDDAKRGKCSWGPRSDVKEIPNKDYPEMHGLLSDRNGLTYSQCSIIKSSSNNAFSYARNYKKRLSKSFSGWFLPSVGQWVEILENLGKVKVQEVVRNQSNGYTVALFDVGAALANLKKYRCRGGDGYWTANECDKVDGYRHNSWDVCLADNYNPNTTYLYTLVKETTMMEVRAVAAF